MVRTKKISVTMSSTCFIILFISLINCLASGQRIPVVAAPASSTSTSEPAADQVPPIEITTPAPTNKTVLELQLQACCGSNCLKFDNLMSMVGVQCCGDTPVNFFDKICCADTKFYDRRSGSKYYDRCCDDRPYSYDQTCCKGKIYDGAAQSCCGANAYHTYDRSLICCNDKLHRVAENSSSPACCGDTVYDAWGKTQFCCGGKVYRRNANHACCVKHDKSDSSSPSEAEGYRPEQQLCCDGVHDLKEFDTCCYVSDVKRKEWSPPKPIPYNSTSQCCDLDGVKTYHHSTGICGP